MKNKLSLSIKLLAGIGLASAVAIPAQAALIGVTAVPLSSAGGAASIIAAPGAALDGLISANAQRGFNEQQGVVLSAAITTDSGVIAAGTQVNSHLILLNQPSGTGGLSHAGVVWTLSNTIIGVMSDPLGALEAASTGQLGSTTTLYPTMAGPNAGALGGGSPIPPYAGYGARGMEGADSYLVSGSAITVNMFVGEPGDWIRVITAVPEPGEFLLLGVGLGTLFIGYRRMHRA